MEIFFAFFSQIISAKARLNFFSFFLRFFHPSPSFQPLKKIVCFLPFVLNWIKKKAKKKNISPSRGCPKMRRKGKSRNEKRAWAFFLSFWRGVRWTLAGDIESFRYPSSKEKQRERKVLFWWRVVCVAAKGGFGGKTRIVGVSRVMGTKKGKKPGDKAAKGGFLMFF